MRIKQGIVGLSFFRPRTMKRFELIKYSDPHKSAVFFGVFRMKEKIAKHQSLGVCVWIGGDALRLLADKEFQDILKRKSDTIKHVANSNFISADLNSLGLPHVKIPFALCNPDDYPPSPKGDSVYAYVAKNDRKKLNTDKVEYVKTHIPFEMEICDCNTYSKANLIDIYRRSFVGIKLSTHEGFSQTSAEMGFMGRQVVSRVESPNSIYWKDEDHVIDLIEKEYENKKYLETANKMREFLKYRDDFLHTEFWK